MKILFPQQCKQTEKNLQSPANIFTNFITFQYVSEICSFPNVKRCCFSIGNSLPVSKPSPFFTSLLTTEYSSPSKL